MSAQISLRWLKFSIAIGSSKLVIAAFADMKLKLKCFCEVMWSQSNDALITFQVVSTDLAQWLHACQI